MQHRDNTIILKCSPPVTGQTKAVLTQGSFHFSLFRSTAMAGHQSTGWFKFKHQKRCIKNTTIYGNGRSVQAMAVDECDSTMGWDKDHDFQPRCDDNIIDASRAVWEARRMPKSKRGTVVVYWSDS